MERKYYLRGLGIGIVVTAIIMGIATSGKRGMTDEEIIARAKELGMVENTVLSEKTEEEAETEAAVDIANAEDATEKSAIEETKKPETSTEQKQNTTEETEKPETSEEQKENTTEETKKPETSTEQKQNITEETKKPETSTEQQTTADKKEDITSAVVKTITVNSGDGSYTVAQKLAEAGVVTSAENFDTYLCQNGYDKKLRTGNFSIPADASDEQIARIVTGAE
ncbi:MAG: hypothetical protein PUF03_03810 [Lachnospiraceae bacterium]|nr:hypothetical protein [Lachnospiraceae bacterium]